MQVPEFVHSIAAMLAASPLLSSYRSHLLGTPALQQMLALPSCLQVTFLLMDNLILTCEQSAFSENGKES